MPQDTTASDAKDASRQAPETITITIAEYELLIQQGQDLAHVVAYNLDTRDLAACGCEQCQRVHEGMLGAGLVSEPWP